MKRVKLEIHPVLTPLVEAMKEPLRLAVLGGVSTFITVLIDQLVKVPQTEMIVVLVFILRFVDRWMHERGKVSGNDVLLKGLTRF